MLNAPPLIGDRARCDSLSALNLLDTPSEERFDRFTRLAQQVFGVPIVLISLVDEKRQWFKSRQGLSVTETPRAISFCGHALQSEVAFVVEDTLRDDRFLDNPLVVGEPNIRFYAGQPLRGPGGYLVGTLCLIDHKPRLFNGNDRNRLRDLAQMVEEELVRYRRADVVNPASTQKPGGLARLLSRFSLRYLSVRVAAEAAILSVLLLLAVAAAWDRQQLEDYREEVEKNAQQRLNIMRSTLESSLNAKLHLVHALSGYVNAPGKIDHDVFSRMAEQLATSVGSIRSLQLAPDGVVTYVWPLATNRKAVGHDLLADPSRRDAAHRAIGAKKIWLAGPINLIQGGQALIARLPVFVSGDGEQKFWGFATTLIDMPGLLAEVGLTAEDERYRYALRGRNALGAMGEVFLGDAGIFDAHSISGAIMLPAGSWELAMVPRDGWPQHWPSQRLFRMGALLLAGFIGCLIYFLLRLPNNMRRAVTEATTALDRNESQFRDAIEALPDGFVIFDANDRLVVCNENFRRLYEPCRPRLQPGRSFREIFKFGLEHGLLADIDSASVGSISTVLERLCEQHRQPQTSYEEVLAGATTVRVVERRMRDGGMVSFHMDVTRSKAAEVELVDARQRAEMANQTKSDFLATVSHEVRTPLNGVLGLLSVVQADEGLTAQQQQYLKTAHESARYLLEILNEILDLSKLEADKLELDTVTFPLAETLNDAMQLVQGQADLKGLELRSNIAAELDCLVQGDQGRLRQVLLNLFSNAIKFTDHGWVALKAGVLTEDSNSVALKIEIADSGIGFEQSDAARLFDNFSQLDADSSRRFTGTGLGLAICKRLVGLMGGEISARGKPGAGATFAVTLTLPRGDSLQVDAATDRIIAAPLPVELGWPPVRVLLAEDSPTNQIVIEAMLKDTGYVLDVVANGSEAINAAAQFHYDVILMDVYMPEVDGITATREIRRDAPQRDVPIIALTANAMRGDQERYLESGMDDYLPKPVNKADLLLTLYKKTYAQFGGDAKTQTE